MDDAQTLVTRYLETFNETDAARRRELLGSVYVADCTYTDPHVDLRGAEQIGCFIEQTQDRFPGFTFALGGPVDAHHNQARCLSRRHASTPGASAGRRSRGALLNANPLHVDAAGVLRD